MYIQTDQGVKNLPVDVAEKISATDPDYGIRDMYEAIAKGNCVSFNDILIHVGSIG